MAAEIGKVECLVCRYYYVTWDERHPHGCRAMNFKSKMIPSVVVMNSSGQQCLLFKNKRTPIKRS